MIKDFKDMTQEEKAIWRTGHRMFAQGLSENKCSSDLSRDGWRYARKVYRLTDEVWIIETPYYIGDKKMIKLYKLVNGEWKLVDYGVPAKAEEYAAQGYIVMY